MKKDKEFTLYWIAGKREVVHGRTVAGAMRAAGYNGRALPALAFYASGNDNRYRWNPTKREWDVVEEPVHERHAVIR